MFSALVITVLIFMILILGLFVAMSAFMWVGVGIYKRALKEGLLSSNGLHEYS